MQLPEQPYGDWRRRGIHALTAMVSFGLMLGLCFLTGLMGAAPYAVFGLFLAAAHFLCYWVFEALRELKVADSSVGSYAPLITIALALVLFFLFAFVYDALFPP